MIISIMTMAVISSLTLTFPVERLIFLKEFNSGFYRVNSYFFGKISVEIPYIILVPIIISLGVYWSCALRVGGYLNFGNYI